MSFTAFLKIGGEPIRVLHADYDFTQPTNASGQPVSKPVSGLINLTIESSKDSEPLEWMINHQMVKNGELVFYRTDAHSEMRKIEFENAYCVYYKEVFDTYNNLPMVIHLRLSPQRIKVAGQNISMEWTIKDGGDGGSNSAQPQSAPAPAGGGVSSFIAD